MSTLIHVRVFPEGESIIAQGLEYDVTGHGQDAPAAIENFRRTMYGQIALNKRDEKPPFAELPAAPFPYWCGITRPELVGVWIDPDEIQFTGAAARKGEKGGQINN